jgi:hypothetical protein
MIGIGWGECGGVGALLKAPSAETARDRKLKDQYLIKESYSESDIRRSIDGLCFSFLTRLGLSTRFTDGTVPIAARDMVLTAVVALKVFFFFFFGMARRFNHKGQEGSDPFLW